MSNPSAKANTKKHIASKIPTSGSGRDSGTHSRSSSTSNLTTASDMHSGLFFFQACSEYSVCSYLVCLATMPNIWFCQNHIFIFIKVWPNIQPKKSTYIPTKRDICVYVSYSRQATWLDRLGPNFIPIQLNTLGLFFYCCELQIKTITQ